MACRAIVGSGLRFVHCYKALGSDLLPEMDEGGFIIDYITPAGSSLQEIVESIKRVAEIVTSIASASAEQSAGIEEVNQALNRIDEVTQQNSALVEHLEDVHQQWKRQMTPLGDLPGGDNVIAVLREVAKTDQGIVGFFAQAKHR